MLLRTSDNDRDKRYFRSSERLFRANEAWYFASREGDQGPYRTEAEASLAMSRYTDGMAEVERRQAEKRAAARKESVEEIELRVVGGDRVLVLELEEF